MSSTPSIGFSSGSTSFWCLMRKPKKAMRPTNSRMLIPPRT